MFAEFRPAVPIYVLATTGGAASLLPDLPELGSVVRAIDLEILHKLERLWNEFPIRPELDTREPNSDLQSPVGLQAVPSTAPGVAYPLTMQIIVDEISRA